MTNFLFILLQAEQTPTKGDGSFMQFLPLILIVVVFYLFFIRPQMKKSKEQRRFRENLKKGDKVVTIGGIHGKIIELRDTTVILEIDGQNRLTIERSAIAMDRQSQLGEQRR